MMVYFMYMGQELSYFDFFLHFYITSMCQYEFPRKGYLKNVCFTTNMCLQFFQYVFLFMYMEQELHVFAALSYYFIEMYKIYFNITCIRVKIGVIQKRYLKGMSLSVFVYLPFPAIGFLVLRKNC